MNTKDMTVQSPTPYPLPPTPSLPLRRRGRQAFTLIEMLVVVGIIAVLAGLAFRLIGLTRKAEDTKIVATLQRLTAAIEEFYAEYGIYPPVNVSDIKQSMAYGYPSHGKGKIPPDLPNETADYLNACLHYGLLSYLIPHWEDFPNEDDTWEERPKGNYYENHLKKESTRALQMKRRAYPHLYQIVSGGLSWATNFPKDSYIFTNRIYNVDGGGLGSPYRYRSPPPYISYELWWEDDDTGEKIYAGKDTE